MSNDLTLYFCVMDRKSYPGRYFWTYWNAENITEAKYLVLESLDSDEALVHIEEDQTDLGGYEMLVNFLIGHGLKVPT